MSDVITVTGVVRSDAEREKTDRFKVTRTSLSIQGTGHLSIP